MRQVPPRLVWTVNVLGAANAGAALHSADNTRLAASAFRLGDPPMIRPIPAIALPMLVAKRPGRSTSPTDAADGLEVYHPVGKDGCWRSQRREGRWTLQATARRALPGPRIAFRPDRRARDHGALHHGERSRCEG